MDPSCLLTTEEGESDTLSRLAPCSSGALWWLGQYQQTPQGVVTLSRSQQPMTSGDQTDDVYDVQMLQQIAFVHCLEKENEGFL